MLIRSVALSALAAFGAAALVSTASGQPAHQRAAAPLSNASSVERWSVSQISQLLNSCLSQSGNLTAGTEEAWAKAKVSWFNHPVSAADQMNGFTQLGMVMLEVPVRTAPYDWGRGTACFTYQRRNGVSNLDLDESEYACREANELTARNFVMTIYDGGHWPCFSRG
jgi:hypothetical protein